MIIPLSASVAHISLARLTDAGVMLQLWVSITDIIKINASTMGALE